MLRVTGWFKTSHFWQRLLVSAAGLGLALSLLLIQHPVVRADGPDDVPGELTQFHTFGSFGGFGRFSSFGGVTFWPAWGFWPYYSGSFWPTGGFWPYYGGWPWSGGFRWWW